jgi:hypothetical protein
LDTSDGLAYVTHVISVDPATFEQDGFGDTIMKVTSRPPLMMQETDFHFPPPTFTYHFWYPDYQRRCHKCAGRVADDGAARRPAGHVRRPEDALV